MTSLAWKGDFLVFGDAEGIQCLWDLKAKISRSVDHHDCFPSAFLWGGGGGQEVGERGGCGC